MSYLIISNVVNNHGLCFLWVRWKRSLRQIVPWQRIDPTEAAVSVLQKWIRWRGIWTGHQTCQQPLGQRLEIQGWKMTRRIIKAEICVVKVKNVPLIKSCCYVILKVLLLSVDSCSSSCGTQDHCSSVVRQCLERSNGKKITSKGWGKQSVPDTHGWQSSSSPNLPCRARAEPALTLCQNQTSRERNCNAWWVYAPRVFLSVGFLMQFVSHACGRVMWGRALIIREAQPIDE